MLLAVVNVLTLFVMKVQESSMHATPHNEALVSGELSHQGPQVLSTQRRAFLSLHELLLVAP